MSEANLPALFWEGFRIDSYEVKASDQLHIRLAPGPDVIPVRKKGQNPFLITQF